MGMATPFHYLRLYGACGSSTLKSNLAYSKSSPLLPFHVENWSKLDTLPVNIKFHYTRRRCADQLSIWSWIVNSITEYYRVNTKYSILGNRFLCHCLSNPYLHIPGLWSVFRPISNYTTIEAIM